MSTGIFTGLLIMAKGIAPLLLWGQDDHKTESLFKTLPGLSKNTRNYSFNFGNTELYADQLNHIVEAAINIEEKTKCRTSFCHLFISGRFLCGNKNSFKL